MVSVYTVTLASAFVFIIFEALASASMLIFEALGFASWGVTVALQFRQKRVCGLNKEEPVVAHDAGEYQHMLCTLERLW